MYNDGGSADTLDDDVKHITHIDDGINKIKKIILFKVIIRHTP